MRKSEPSVASDNVPRAIAAVVFAVFALSLNDAVIKLISVNFSLWQLFALRSAIALPVLLVIIKIWRPYANLIPQSIGWVFIRSLLLALMWVAYFSALPHLQLSVAAAAYYTLPLFIILISALLTGERVGAIGWVAVCLGFLGVLVMLRPEVDGFNTLALLPILAAIFYAFAMIITRTKCRSEDVLVLSVALNVSFIIVGGFVSLFLAASNLNEASVLENAFLLGEWVDIGFRETIALVFLAVALLIGSIFAAVAYQSASPSTVAPFDYCYLVFSVMWGFVFFAELPDILTMTGIAMIAAAGIIAMRC